VTRRQKSSRGASLATLAQPYALAALVELVRIMTRSRSDAARVAAAKALLDRGFGKPPHSLGLATADVPPLLEPRDNMSIEELADEFRRLRQMPFGDWNSK
jgi:hypothetical protein